MKLQTLFALLVLLALGAAHPVTPTTVTKSLEYAKRTRPTFGFCGVPGQACGASKNLDISDDTGSAQAKRDEAMALAAIMNEMTMEIAAEIEAMLNEVDADVSHLHSALSGASSPVSVLAEMHAAIANASRHAHGLKGASSTLEMLSILHTLTNDTFLDHFLNRTSSDDTTNKTSIGMTIVRHLLLAGSMVGLMVFAERPRDFLVFLLGTMGGLTLATAFFYPLLRADVILGLLVRYIV